MPPDFLPTHHRSLRLQNFTAFGDATFDFVPGVNVLVGENGTGKTHALKALYGLTGMNLALMRNVRPLEHLFINQDPFQLRRWNSNKDAVVTTDHASATVRDDGTGGEVSYHGSFSTPEPVFLTAIDVIGHTQGFLALERSYGIDFDRTFGDLVSKLELTAKDSYLPLARHEMQVIESRMGGTVEYEKDMGRFFLNTPRGGLAMPLVAEGLRKFATLHTIWKNGWLRPGTCLFWDEPEANLNPSLMDEAVAAILALARGGVQVFLATHSYVILKELELQATEEDSLRYFALEKADEGTVVNPADRLEDLHPNAILAQYERLYNLDLEKTIQGKRR